LGDDMTIEDMQIDKNSSSSEIPVVTPAARFQKMPEIVSSPEVSNYMDFRLLLSDYYRYRRELSKNDIRPYNYSVFSAAANIKSPNYLKMIIEGKRNLSADMIAKFAKAMSFNKDQSEEFRMLVMLGQASDPGERNLYLKELSEFRVNNQIKSGEIDRKQFEKVPSWIAWILFAMMDQQNVDFRPESLRELLRGKASTDEIESALQTLIRNGDVALDAETGTYKKARNLTSAPEEIPVALVRKLQSQLMYLGMESLYQDSAIEREFGTATLTLTQKEFEEIKFKLRQIRKEINKDNAVAREQSKGERVYQLNIQLFPVSNKA
jgi:uncharacterized protein (TIGR02147 family)